MVGVGCVELTGPVLFAGTGVLVGSNDRFFIFKQFSLLLKKKDFKNEILKVKTVSMKDKNEIASKFETDA